MSRNYAHDLGLQEAFAMLEATEWREPEPLPELLPAVPEFSESQLPDALRAWVMDIAERMQCPPDFPGVAAMVALGSVVGRRIGIHPKRYDSWLEVPNLWGAIVARPGYLKSPSLSEGLRPLRRLEAHARESFAEEATKREAGEVVGKARLEALQQQMKIAAKSGKEDELRAHETKYAEMLKEQEGKSARRYMTNDATTAKIGMLLNENPTGLMCVRDELVGWIRGLDQPGNEPDRGFYDTPIQVSISTAATFSPPTLSISRKRP